MKRSYILCILFTQMLSALNPTGIRDACVQGWNSCRSAFNRTRQFGRNAITTTRHASRWINNHPLQAIIGGAVIGHMYGKNRNAAIIATLCIIFTYHNYIHAHAPPSPAFTAPLTASSNFDNAYEMERQCSWCHQKRWLPVRCDQCYAEFCEECITHQCQQGLSGCRKCKALLDDALGYFDQYNVTFN
ncbi:MAG: hypothetical protein WD068_02860 [Candidatus Babeliales bacterium]